MDSNAIYWLCLAVVLGIIETTTVNLVTVWFAISALIVSVLSMLGVSPIVSAVCFIVISAVLLVLTRPLARRVLNKHKVRTNADRIVGAEGVVIKRIDSVENSGQIKVLGQVWSAKSVDGLPISEGSQVTVLDIEGVRAVVKNNSDR